MKFISILALLVSLLAVGLIVSHSSGNNSSLRGGWGKTKAPLTA